MNWSAMTVFQDPGHMFEWLETELDALEALNSTAIILGHVPNLYECLSQYGKRLHSLMDRYQHIIRWSMYSHTHQEQFQIISDIATSKPIGMSYIIGSATTFQGKPPQFNIMYVDPVTMLPVDYEVWAFDLEGANKNDVPAWNMIYDMRKEYNLTDLSPASWYKASLNILQDETAAIAYRTRRFTNGPGARGTSKTEPCDGKCRQKYYCETSSSEYQSWYTCMNQNFEMLGATKG